MMENTICPKCGASVPAGKFCEQCGASLAAERIPPIPPRPSPIQPQPPSPPPPRKPPFEAQSGAHTKPAVAIDALCIQNDSWGDGFVRVLFDPGEGIDGCDNVTLTLTDQSTGSEYVLMKDSWCNRQRELSQIVKHHALGPVVYAVSLSYEKNNRRSQLVGDWATVSTTDAQVGTMARQLVVNIHNEIKTGHACDINASSLVKDKLDDILTSGHDVSQKLRDLVCGSDRAYLYLDLFDESGIAPLPPQPPEAKADRLVLDLGSKRLFLFSNRVVTFGRDCDRCDISWRHPNADRISSDDPANSEYRKISRRQCLFEHRGEKVALIDGGRNANGQVVPSSYGTYLNTVRVEGERILEPKETGYLSFSDSTVAGSVKVCQPGDFCEQCRRVDRLWCEEGHRPSLVLKRLDEVPETAVMVWSCFRLEEVDPSFKGVKIFCEAGAFAWRRGRRCGWLVPGVTIETAVGTVRVTALKPPSGAAETKDEKTMSGISEQNG